MLSFWALTVAIAAGTLTVALTSEYLASVKKAPTIVKVVQNKVEMATVVTAAGPIAHGRVIRPGDLRMVKWPADAVPKGAFRNVIDILGAEKDRVALSNFAAGEIVTEARVSKPGERPSLALMLAPGMRAIAVRVNAVLGVGGFVMPGDRIDLLLTERANEDKPESTRSTEVLLRDVRVLAIDQQTEDPEYKPRVVSTVTLEVSLPEAQKITLATTIGSISLALRSSLAPREEKVADAAPAAKPKAKRKDTTLKIVVFRSAKPTEYKVPFAHASLAQ